MACLSIASAGGLIMLSNPASADLLTNGLSMNGLSMNGFAVNGLSMNGVNSQAVGLHNVSNQQLKVENGQLVLTIQPN
ncbi:MAG TPA: hypothetical protein V6D29_11785 [Leptolyngbyaceae cyanobacterium]